MTTDSLALARQRLLVPAGLGEDDLQRTLSCLLGHAIDGGDLYFQLRRAESWALEDGQVKQASHAIQHGVGVRAVSGEKTGFAYSDEIVPTALLEAATAARAIARHGGAGQLQMWRSNGRTALYQPLDPLESLTAEAKIRLLEQVDAEARRQDPRVAQVMVSLAGTQDTILVAGSDGTLAGDVRPLARLNVTVIVEQQGRREQGSSGGGGRVAYGWFLDEERALRHAREAVRLALVNLEAVAAPAGTMTVVLGPGWPGILLHEAIGHGLEGDFNRKGTSAFSGRIGERVASPLCTVVDDGTLANRRGSLNIDDEGTPTQCTTLIERGVLKGYLQDKLNARLMKTASTGNGRRESYAHLPLPRMTNTYLLAGAHDPSEIIASVEQGLYAVNFGGGQVDITSGKFVFSASEAYLIENGRVTRPVKGATLIGNGPDVLTQVSMVGNDLKLDAGVGTCGKDGQSVPVGVGQPTLKVDALTVGGTQA
ncbi:MAG: metalloprotease TldD [Candidatus Competibacteraceae bacterium]|nr:metalloprotease TldD [Candidatus Competibacteraceae bacterium]MBK7983358.1 metalloprotease TldD [Candidatus Competibacteraceae bacterium]MBK8898096.1 metalloprotease TldD [Candidatus Competibacteraceae bacterium]MBK8961902.1 metalloprotease TldD [Candidatus Competibacteraceae bacterium]MBK9951118.1 metalloprotease TldD [Candidatus Competibacteraceae bacterium]